MKDVFEDQCLFMRACGQTVDQDNKEQFELYAKLIGEEVNEFWTAVEQQDDVEIFDALIDIIVVAIGAGLSKGYPMGAGWDTVLASNMRKINPMTGTVDKREDGKVIKPAGWRAPNLARLLEKVNAK
jgi:predicted HAD superfamily Cof-like phosphohydrolase